MCVAVMLTALSGFWNAIIFFRPTYKRLRDKGKGRWQAFKIIVANDKSSQQNNNMNNAAAAANKAKKNRNPYANTRRPSALAAPTKPKPIAENLPATAAAPTAANEINPSHQKEVLPDPQEDDNVIPGSDDDDDEEDDDDYSEVAAETIPALIMARLSGETKEDDDDNNNKDNNSGEEEKTEEKILTPGAFENTVRFPGESQYTVPSTHHA